MELNRDITSKVTHLLTQRRDLKRNLYDLIEEVKKKRADVNILKATGTMGLVAGTLLCLTPGIGQFIFGAGVLLSVASREYDYHKLGQFNSRLLNAMKVDSDRSGELECKLREGGHQDTIKLEGVQEMGLDAYELLIGRWSRDRNVEALVELTNQIQEGIKQLTEILHRVKPDN